MAEVRILYIATAAGLVQLANPGKSDRWREIGRALEGQDVRAVAASPHDPLLAYAASSGGVERTENGGASWERVVQSAVAALAFDETGRIVAGTEQGSVLASADGLVWSELGDAPAPIVQFVALADGIVVVGSDGAVGELAGDSWRARDVGISGALGVAARHDAAASVVAVSQSSLATPDGSNELPARATGALLDLHGTPPALLVGTHEALLRSEDQGATLAPVDGPREVTALVSAQRAVDQVFAGTATGELWYSGDRGRSWARVASGFAAVRSLAFARAL